MKNINRELLYEILDKYIKAGIHLKELENQVKETGISPVTFYHLVHQRKQKLSRV